MVTELKYPLNLELIEARLDDMKEAVLELEQLREVPMEDFLDEGELYLPAAENYLRKALQAMLKCVSQALSRIPGAKLGEYKENARQLGKFGIISEELTRKVVKMAGYRNRMIHFYYEIAPEEIYEIIQNDLPDLDLFIKEIAQFVKERSAY